MTAVLRPRMRALLFVFTFFIFLVDSALAAGLAGRVIDPDGRPVPNAEVFVTGPTATPLRARTDAEGKFDLSSLAAGRYTVIASAPGLVSEAHSIDVSEGTTLEIPLHISAVSESLVVSAAQIGQPLSRTPASVTVFDGRDIDAKPQLTLASAPRSAPG